jgi:geranylgeranyl pyrophosphate synthase
MHDDVIDESTERRGGAALHSLYSNKVAILAGDFLLARASVQMARLQNCKVVELISSALDSLVQGEIMQARSSGQELLDMSHYIRKSYMKTASLICNSCKAVSLLSGNEENSILTKSCERFGNHLGLAFQIVDDILDFAGSSAKLGKPAQADMKLGLATAPLLYASKKIPDLREIIARKFKQPGDVAKAVELSANSDCIEKSYELAYFHAQEALDALQYLSASNYQKGLIDMVHIVVRRQS